MRTGTAQSDIEDELVGWSSGDEMAEYNATAASFQQVNNISLNIYYKQYKLPFLALKFITNLP